MTAPIWMAFPPEVHSALLSSGPGPGPLLASAEAWNSLSTAYTETADELTALLGAAQAGAWDGPSAEVYVAAHAPYLAWLMQAAANSKTIAVQQETAAAAYTAAQAAMPTLAELAANHATHAVLVATNFFGINTIPIALNEADYARMWVQAATTMSTYQAVSTAAVAAAPQTTPAPQIVKSNAASSDPPPNPVDSIFNFLTQLFTGQGYTNFYNNFLGPLGNLSLYGIPLAEYAFIGNPFFFFSPENLAFAFGVPIDPGTFVGLLSSLVTGTLAGLPEVIGIAGSTGNPLVVAIALIFNAIEFISFVITNIIQLLHWLLDQPLILAVTLPLLAAPLGAAVGTLGGLGIAGVAYEGLHELVPAPPPVAPALAPPVAIGPVSPTLIPSPAPAPAPAPVPASAPATAPAGAPSAPPPHTPPPPVGLGDFSYMVGSLHLRSGREASTSARKKKAPEPETAPAAAAAQAAEKAQARRRRRAKAQMLGQGDEYMDLDQELDSAPGAAPADQHSGSSAASDQGAGTLGFAGTTRTDTTMQPAGLTTLVGGVFADDPRTPMMPSSWSDDPDQPADPTKEANDD
ncbi:PPE family protein [Mycobacterium sp. SM1]|uniref:PPE family protein n=1 Tax=Mycobacterium sp. SM1 TaxID=2816243 RepID=UPI001BD19038|nr:PPE family protein [Mycobacterium sp. SM1]MBS4728328.1 PPE family protein [Mycobacterium sp. SM1]